jgi:PhnB protein
MSDKVNPIPEGYQSITPHLIIDGAADAIEYYKKAFGAEELFRMPGPGGKLGHAEIKIGNSHIMLCDEFPEMGAKGPQAGVRSPVSLMLYVDNVDEVFARAVEAGAKETMAVADMFWGDRYGKLTDPFGHDWAIATHVRDVSPEEMEAAAKAWASQAESGASAADA